jgi:excisionase family DNA binding protein
LPKADSNPIFRLLQAASAMKGTRILESFCAPFWTPILVVVNSSNSRSRFIGRAANRQKWMRDDMTNNRRKPAAVETAADKPDGLEPAREKRVEYLTAQQLAEVLQVSESTIHRLRRAGRLPAVELTGRLIRFNLRDVQKALKALQTARPHEDGGEPHHDDEPTAQLSFDDLFAEFSEP